jgi:hypothetical protein
MPQRPIFTVKSVRRSGNGGGNFSVEFVFYEREHDTHYGEHGDRQNRDSIGPAAARELPAGTFCGLHDVVDGGISFLLFVDAAGGSVCGNDACSALAKSAGLGISTEFAEGA